MTRHLDGLDWEVIVVKNTQVNAMCVPGGKITVYTGFLDYFKTDAEVAAVLGHEVFLDHFYSSKSSVLWAFGVGFTWIETEIVVYIFCRSGTLLQGTRQRGPARGCCPCSWKLASGSSLTVKAWSSVLPNYSLGCPAHEGIFSFLRFRLFMVIYAFCI
jgi:hypothetical protein